MDVLFSIDYPIHIHDSPLSTRSLSTLYAAHQLEIYYVRSEHMRKCGGRELLLFLYIFCALLPSIYRSVCVCVYPVLSTSLLW